MEKRLVWIFQMMTFDFWAYFLVEMVWNSLQLPHSPICFIYHDDLNEYNYFIVSRKWKIQ